MNNKKFTAVIAAAGSGTRMGGVSKPNIMLLGKTLFEYVLEAVNGSVINEIVVVCSADNIDSLKELSKISQKPIRFVLGGKMRAESICNGILASSDDSHIICAHDCARPFITSEMIDKTCLAAAEKGAACVCSPVVDTLKYKDPETGLISTPDRNNMFAVQTPQCFEKELYFKAKEFAGEAFSAFTDETSILENYGAPVEYIKWADTNIKLTAIDDVPIAEILMKRRLETK